MKLQPRTQLPPPPPKKSTFPWILFVFVLVWSWFVWDSITPRLPQANQPAKLYSNQCRQDIRSTLLSAMKSATKSIHLVMFGLTDRPILNALAKKIDEGIPTTIYFDIGGSGKINRYLQGSDLHPIKNGGLMHQKILIVDNETVFIGSANMTSASMQMHDNLVVGLTSEQIAKFLIDHKPYHSGYYKTKVGGQEIEIWLLPDPRGSALSEIRKKIRAAKKSIRIALFTFTHPGLVEELISAHEKGIKVTVVIDMHSGLGASAKVVEKLISAGLRVHLSKGIQLLHHKLVYIDEETLITGSANWTKSAFYKNSDCILCINHLVEEQKKFMNHLWKSIEGSVAKNELTR